MTIDLRQKRILITRGEREAGAFADQVTYHGGQAIVTPLIKITCTSKLSQRERVKLTYHYEWIMFTSANGVNCFFNQMDLAEKQIKQARFAVVGPKTNQALQAFGYEADYIPHVYNAKTMAQDFLKKYRPNGPVLLVQGQLSGTDLEAAFKRDQIQYESLTVYETRTNAEAKEELLHIINTNNYDFITFMSPSSVDAFIELTGESGSKASTIVCVGTTTASRALEQGFTHILVPDTFTIEGMMKKIDEFIRRERKDK